VIKILAGLFVFALAPMFGQGQDTLPEPTQRTDAPYRLFRTRNMFTFLRLDTRTGEILQIQWNAEDDKRFAYPLSLVALADGKKPGRFTLTPTTNIFNFILTDQEDGRVWQVQWSTEPERRLVLPIVVPTEPQVVPAGLITVLKGGAPTKPDMADFKTWGEYDAALAQYEKGHDAWLVSETRRQVEEEVAVRQKKAAK